MDLINANETTTTEIKKPSFRAVTPEEIDRGGEQILEQRNANFDKYGIKLRDDEYYELNRILDTLPENEREDYAYSFALGKEYSKILNISFDDAMNNMDNLNTMFFGTDRDLYPTKKSAFTAIRDSYNMGQNTIRMGELGHLLLNAETHKSAGGDLTTEEQLKAYMAEYQALLEDNAALQDKVPRGVLTDIAKYAAQSAPFTIEAIARSSIPVVGGVMGFQFSSENAAGLEYMDLRTNGCPTELAANIATISGGIQGLIELALGNVAGALGAQGKSLFKKNELVKKVTESVAKKFHFNGIWRAIAKTAMEYGEENIEQGTEEVLQQLTSYAGQYLADTLSDEYNFNITPEQMRSELWENFKGGFAGSLLLGLPTAGFNMRANLNDVKEVKRAAETIPSDEAFAKAVKDNPIFDGMSEEAKDQAIKDIREKSRDKLEESYRKQEKDIAEVYTNDEIMEVVDTTEDEEGDIISEEIPEVYKTKDNKLYTENNRVEDNKGKYTAGNPETGKNYGYIDYTVDDDNGIVTIDNFKMASHRDNVRNEFFIDFANEFNGYDIKWDAKGKLAQDIKSQLEALNPQGSKYGLSFFSNIDRGNNADIRVDIARQFAENTNFTAEQQIAGRALLDLIGKNAGGLDKFMSEHFANNQIFADKNVKANVNNNLKTKISEEIDTLLTGKMTAEEARALGLREDQAEIVNNALANIDDDTRQALKEYALYRGGKNDAISTEQKTIAENAIKENKELAKVMYKANDLAGQTVKGAAIDIADGIRKVIYVSENGDFSTFVHELAHVWRSALNDTDLKEVEKAFDVKDGNWTTEKEENFARGFEQFLLTGKADNPELKNIFAKIADFLKEVYNTLKNLEAQSRGFKLNDDIVNTFNKLLAEDNSGLNQKAEVKEEIKSVTTEETKEKPVEPKKEKKTTLDEVTDTAMKEIIADPTLTESQKNTAALNAAGQDEVENLIRYFDEKAKEEVITADDAKINGFSMDDDGNVYEMMFQLIGEQGMRIIDDLYDNYYTRRRMNALENAQKMDAEGKSAEEIFSKTQWKKNEDLNNTWWTEIDDGEIKNPVTIANILSKLVEIKNALKEANTTTKLDKLAEKNAEVINSLKGLKLKDIYDAKEVYKICPALADVEVHFTDTLVPVHVTLGSEGINFNLHYTNDVNKFRGGIIHEIQRVMQGIEVDFDGGQTFVMQNAQTWQDFDNWMKEKYGHNWAMRSYEFTASNIKDFLNSEDFNSYKTNPYEQQARVARDRANMNELQRKNMLFQIIGEKGAAELDKAEDKTERIDNLNIAQEMEAAGKDAETIRLATGWEKGADGKWKYEIPDFIIKENPTWNLIENDQGDYHAGKLSDLINAPELFKAYPELKDFDVHTGLFSNSLGEYSELLKMISLNNNYEKTINKEREQKINALKETKEYKNYQDGLDKILAEDISTEEAYNAWIMEVDNYNQKFYNTEIGKQIKDLQKTPRFIKALSPEVRNTLVHEIQHAIQHIEGFAKGGSPETVNKEVQKLKDAFDIVYFYSEIEDKYKEDPDTYKYNQLKILYDIKQEYKEGNCLDWLPSESVMDKAFNYWVRGYGIEEQEKLVKDNGLDKHTPLYSKDGFTNYHHLAGEVESRNVESRMNFTVEQRKNQLLENTEDVARKNQIILFQTLTDDQKEEIKKNAVDLTEEYGSKPTVAEVKNYINSLLNKVIFTLTPNKTLIISSKTKGHVFSGSKSEQNRYKKNSKRKQRRMTYLSNLEELGKKAIYEKSVPNTDPLKKVKNFHYFSVNVKFGEHVWKVNLAAEEKNGGIAPLGLVTAHHGMTDTAKSDTSILLENAQVDNFILYDVAESEMLLQTAYHGSAASFEDFDLDYGFSGEGSMTFGYGVYLTGSEVIARDYAERQTNEKNQSEFAETMLQHIENGKSFEDELNFALDRYKKYVESGHVDYAQNRYTWLKSIKSIDDLKKAADKTNKRNLYTVEIPDNGFIVWDKEVRKPTADKIKKAVFREITTNPNSAYYNYYSKTDLMKELDSVFSNIKGMQLYNNVSAYLEGDENASKFLYSIGYNGIDYPAGTIHGNGREARNYVIFKEKDAKIVDHIKYQTETDLKNLAQSFDSWQDFMEYFEAPFIDEDIAAMVPQDANTSWYQNYWEMAHNITPTTEEMQEESERNYFNNEREDTDPVAADSIFLTEIRTKAGMLETFLKQIDEVMKIDADEWANDALDEQDREDAENIRRVQQKIRGLHNQAFIRNSIRVAGGKPLSEKMRKNILTAIRNATRSYRGIYATVMSDNRYLVDDAAENAAMDELAERGRKAGLDKDPTLMSPTERIKYADDIREKEIADEIRKGTFKYDDEAEFYIKRQREALYKANKEYKELKTKVDEDFNALGDVMQRDLMKLYGKLLEVKSELEYKKMNVPSKLERTIENTAKYNRDLSALQDRYSTLYTKYKDAEKAIEVTAEFRQKLDHMETYTKAKAEYKQLRKEQKAIDELREIRKKLVKRTMRKVDFKNVEYDHAKALIALQRIFDPNMRQGVNKWIGIEEVSAREIWSDYRTDEEEKKRITDILTKSPTGADLLHKLDMAKTERDFDLITDKDKKTLERRLANSDWIKKLQLDRLKYGREQAIQLDISEVERKLPTGEIDQYGNEKYTNEVIAEYSDEIAALLEDYFPADLVQKVQAKPFQYWTIAEMEDLAKTFQEVYAEGRNELNAKKIREQTEAYRIRELIAQQVRDTGIVINEDDPEDVKKKKQEKIAKILGTNNAVKGLFDEKENKFITKMNAILHGYHDANIRRVARILDGYNEGTCTAMLYWKENECYTRQENAKNRRYSKVEKVMAENNIDVAELFKEIEINYKGEKKSQSIDKLLFIAQAVANNNAYQEEQAKQGIPVNKREEESSYQAVVYGCLMTADEKQQWIELDKNLKEQEDARKAALDLAYQTGDEAQINELKKVSLETHDESGNLLLPGREKIKQICKERLEEFMKVYETLDPKYKALQEAIAADYDQEFERINRASVEEFNMPVWREKWYLPLIRKGVTGDTHEARVRADLMGTMAGTGKAGTEKGFTQKRVKIAPENQTPVELGLYSTWADSVERNEHFINYASYVRELNRLFANKDAQPLMQEIQNRYGRGMKNYIDSYIKEVANPNVGEPVKDFDRVIRFLRGSTAPAYLGFKASSVIKQALSSPAPFMQFVNPVEYAKAAIRCVNSDTQKAIQSKSVFMRNRVFDPIVDVVNEQKNKSTSPMGYKIKDLETKGMQALEWIDWACVAPGWLAVYDKERAKLLAEKEAMVNERLETLKELNNDGTMGERRSIRELEAQARAEIDEDIEQKAVNKADDCTRLCQPSNRKVDLAPMFKNGSELQKAVLQFQTALNVIWQNIRYDIPYAVRKQQYKQIVGMVLGYVAAGIAMGILADGLEGDDEDEVEKLRRFTYYSMTQFTDSAPVVGSMLTSTAEKVITGKTGYQGTQDIFPTFTKVKDGVFALTDENYGKAAKKFAEGMALSIGLPTSGAKEMGRVFGIGDGQEGLDFYPEALLGRRKDK